MSLSIPFPPVNMEGRLGLITVLAHRPEIGLEFIRQTRREKGGGARKGEKGNRITRGEKASRTVRNTKLFGVKDTRDSRKVSDSPFITEKDTEAQRGTR